MARLAAPWLLALAGTMAAHAEVRSTAMASEGDRYRISVTSFVAAPPDRVMGLLTDYRRLERLHPMVVSSDMLQHVAAGERVHTRYYDCPVFIICMEFAHTSTFHRVSDHHLIAIVDPAASDFSYGRFEWTAVAEDGGTRLEFVAEVEPDFWVPPIIGDWVLKHRLVEVATELQRSIQAIAREEAGAPPHDGPIHADTFDATDW